MHDTDQKTDSRSAVMQSVLKKWRSLVHTVPTVVNLLQATFVVLAGYSTFRYLSSVIYRRYKGYPNGPFCFPIIGSAISLMNPKFYSTTCGLYGALTYGKLFHLNMIYINDSAVAKNILFNRKDMIDRPDSFTGVDSNNKIAELDAMGNLKNTSFFGTNGADWKARRQFALVALVRHCDSKFMSKMTHKLMHEMVFKTLDAISDQNEGKNIWKPNELCHKVSSGSVFHANFGLDSNKLFDESQKWDLMKIMSQVTDSFKDLFIPSLFPPSYTIFKLLFPQLIHKTEHIFAERNRLLFNLIKHRREYYKSHPNIFKEIDRNQRKKYDLCYLDYLLYLLDHNVPSNASNASNASNTLKSETSHLNDFKVATDLALMFQAGTDTTGYTLEYATYLLAKTPHVQEKLYTRLVQHLGVLVHASDIYINNNNYTFDTRGEFEYTQLLACVEFKAFIYELLRISSNVPTGIPHVVKKDTVVKIDGKDYFLPADTTLNLNIDFITRGDSTREHWKNRKYGLDMDDICLENWIVEVNDDEKKSGVSGMNGINGMKSQRKFEMNPSFVAFSTGHRDCPGQQMAIKELHFVIAYLILNYKFELVGNDAKNPEAFEIKRKFSLAYGVANEQGVVVHKR